MSPEELGLLSDSRLIWLPREATRGSLDAHLARMDAAPLCQHNVRHFSL